MKVALIGYGKMGRTIERIATSRGHEIILRVGIENLEDFTAEQVTAADVAIEFTGPESAYSNLQFLLINKVPTVCGSTGWLQHLNEITSLCAKQDAAFLYASNFSLGVNIFMEINKRLAQLLAPYPQYDVAMEEVHHTAKLDAPSGTAITLAEQILAQLSSKQGWVNEPTEDKSALYIRSLRQDPAPGTHTVTWTSDIDDIAITHTAHSRDGFALGAVLAAEFIHGKKGIFTMKDVLGIA